MILIHANHFKIKPHQHVSWRPTHKKRIVLFRMLVLQPATAIE